MENSRRKQTFINGDTYEGQWKDDYFQGIGAYYYSHGLIYNG